MRTSSGTSVFCCCSSPEQELPMACPLQCQQLLKTPAYLGA
eukprot:CAMPEP_0179115882 /NCGR_PEP_ID=MMETSP0796-20121207/54325_1 /TAXON_ID=73915 /ORGANISM="Pyrodinium bahamense, Strain pbaha01" /LENGTH=40 /DNA_ID= /DNA_START= /DNA_END= /DNA_ORIENTATION=